MVDRQDYDSPWKQIIEHLFPQFMAFFFPTAYEDIDWTQGYAFLDKELQQVTPDAIIGPKRVDKLARVHQLGSEKEVWVLVHIEVQSQRDTDFSKRMFVYNYRLFDRYDHQIASMAILADENAHWRPHYFGYHIWGCQMGLDFPAIKLVDYVERWDTLMANPNPFAVVVMAHLQTQQTRHQAQERYVAKLQLAKLLYYRGYTREEILDLFQFIDWLLQLPLELAQQFKTDMTNFEAETNMEYVTSIERLAMQEGMIKGKEEGKQAILLRQLQAKFGELPEAFVEKLQTVQDSAVLDNIAIQLLTAVSLDDITFSPE